MSNVVLFSDVSLPDAEQFSDEDNQPVSKLADLIRELPAKSGGVHRIKTEVRNSGFTCQVIDLFFYFTEDEILRLCKKHITKDTLVVGFSTTFWFNIGDDTDKREKFKLVYKYVKNLDGPKIVFGGTMSANFNEKIKADKSFDGFVDGEFVSYLNEISNRVPVANEFNFSSSQITYDDSDCIDHGESPVIEISRGCIFKCSFCAYPLNGKKKLDYIKDYNVLEEELITNYEKYGITTYTLSDDTFNDSTYKLEYLHRLFGSLPFKVKFVSYLRLDLMNSHREQVALLKEMGLIGAFFGIETLNHKSGQTIGKGLHPEKVKEFLFELKDTHWKNDVNITIGLISGLPFETIQSHQDTLKWINDGSLCNVDRIRPAALSIPNPLIDRYPFKSEFQINAPKYGFYWPNSKSNTWKNMSHEIKSQDMATDMAKEIFIVAKDVKKVTKGNFGLPLTANIAKYGNYPKSISEILSMPVEDHEKWLELNRQDMISGYVNNYKRKKLDI